MAMARAIPTRFCIPPEISAGNFFSAPSSCTRFKQNFTLSSFSFSVMFPNMEMGKATFCSTVRESNNALPWKSIPISVRTSLRCLRFMEVKSLPSYMTFPESTSKSPTMHFVSTDLPLPLRPIMKFTRPLSNSALTSRSTCWDPNDLFTPSTCIM